MAITINGTSGITFSDSSTLPSATFSPIYPITASVASSALTITLNPCAIAFRNSSLASGTTGTSTVSAAISVVVPSTATLGTVSAQQSTLMVLALNNAGTIELAVVNISGGTNLDETTLISTTAIAAASNSASTVYSTTARTSLPFRVVGAIISTQATAGTWATAPSTIQGTGGQAFTSLQSLGYGQTWQDVSGSRTTGTTYYNTTGRPIFINLLGQSASTIYTLSVNGSQVGNGNTVTNNATVSAIAPSGASYVLVMGGTFKVWELR